MSESMIERVAKAICAPMGYDPDGCDDETIPENESRDGWRNWFAFKGEARAAIEAMREPTPNMIDAGFLEWPFGVSSTWQAMIDAALKDDFQRKEG